MQIISKVLSDTLIMHVMSAAINSKLPFVTVKIEILIQVMQNN